MNRHILNLYFGIALAGLLAACASSVAVDPSAVPSGALTGATPAGASTPAGVLPNHDLTPGATDPNVTQSNIGQTICRRGYTAAVRPPATVTEPMKRQSMREYSLQQPLSAYEYDHLIPLELGGAPRDPRNLWPQRRAPAPGAPEKDMLENRLHGEVCSGRLSLAEAQQRIASNWYRVWLDLSRTP